MAKQLNKQQSQQGTQQSDKGAQRQGGMGEKAPRNPAQGNPQQIPDQDDDFVESDDDTSKNA